MRMRMFLVQADVDVKPNPEEVQDFKYVGPEELKVIENVSPSTVRYGNGCCGCTGYAACSLWSPVVAVVQNNSGQFVGYMVEGFGFNIKHRHVCGHFHHPSNSQQLMQRYQVAAVQ